MRSSPWPLRDVTLKVLDLPRQSAFYKDFGFKQLARSNDSATLAAGHGFQLTLRTVPNLQPRPPLTAGLFHFAILVPDRAALGSFLRHASRHQWNFVGAADHLVSEALYFSDPEENGIEVYADRSNESWQWAGDRINMATLPLDLDELSVLPGPPKNTDQVEFPSATRLGHMHLTVTNLGVSQQFYESLGLVLTANWGPFRFLSYDGYHHHVAINLAAGHNATPVSPQFSGMESFSVFRSTVKQPLTDPSHILVTPPDTLHETSR
jgi:catechol 2,3-dioxygenase